MQDPQHLRPDNPDQTVILVVDDEVIIRNIARITLEAERYFILSADDGEEALEISRKFPGKIDAVVSDVKMPNMDGLELRKRMMEERPGVKVLLMSGYISAPTEDIPFLQKPFGPAVLKKRIHQLLDSDVSG